MRNKKLLIQIGLIVTLVFAVMMFLAQKYLLKKNTLVYLEAKNEMITDDLILFSKKDASYLSDDVVSYWIDNKEKVSEPITDDELEIIYGSNKFDFSKPVDFSALTEEEKLVFAKNYKWSVSYDFLSQMNSRGYSDVYLLVPVSETEFFVVAYDENDMMIAPSSDTATASDSDSEVVTSTDAESGADYQFGDIVELQIDQIKDLGDMASKKDDDVIFAESTNPKNDKVYYTGYILMYDSDGNPLGYLCAEYDYSDAYSSILKSATSHLIRNMIVGLFIMGALLLLTLYAVAVRPLKKTKEALDLYKITKNSADVENRLSNFRVKNEIGQFADNVVELAEEIDRYNEENIELATKNAKVKTELDLAARIQSDSLIKKFPESSAYTVFASMTPAKEVGGDFYDVFDMDEDHTVFVIADVSGKGMPAALFMMAAMTTIRNFSLQGRKPSEILMDVNNTLAKRKIMDMFVTVWLGVLDKKTGLLMTSNAGHEYPAINVNGSFELYKDKHGLVAGGYPRVKYVDHEIQLSKGDVVFVYTDGVPEATNAEVQMFTDVRMLEALNKDPSASPEELLRNVKSSVDDFVGAAEQFDDLTMLCIKYNG